MEEKALKTYVKGMYCVQCPELIICALLQLRGVIDADVEYFKSLVTVRFDPDMVTEAQIFAALDDAGYPPFERRPSVAERLAAKLAHAFDSCRGGQNEHI